MRGRRRRRSASGCRSRRRRSKPPRQPALNHAAMLVASGGPTCCSGPINARLSTKFSTSVAMPDLDGRRRVAAGKEARREHLQQHVRRQAKCIGAQRLGAQMRAVRIERTTAEQHEHDGKGRDGERQGRGEGQKQRELDSAVERADRKFASPRAPAGTGRAAAPCRPRPRSCLRELIDPLRVVEQRHGPGRQQAADDDIDRLIELRRACAQAGQAPSAASEAASGA